MFQPHLYSRTKALATELGAALAAADEVAVLDVYPAREERVGPLAGVSGLMVAEAAADHSARRAGVVAAQRGRRRPRARPEAWGGGRADHDRRRGHRQAGRGSRGRGRGMSARRPAGVEDDYPLARLTTIRVGGPGRYFAQPESEEQAGGAARVGGRARASRSGSSGRAPICWSPTRASEGSF